MSLVREKFLEKSWEWKDEYASFIRSQWEKLGLSLDYSRERFTLDEGLSNAVKEVFVKLYEKGSHISGANISSTGILKQKLPFLILKLFMKKSKESFIISVIRLRIVMKQLKLQLLVRKLCLVIQL